MRLGIALLVALAAGPALPSEDADYGVAPSASLRTHDFSAPTPREIPGATTIRTEELRESLRSQPPPLLFDVLGGDAHASLPGAIWLPGAGRGESFTDTVQLQLARALETTTQGNRNRAIVFFCQGPQCWLSYNAALRAAALGYQRAYWYRGGIEAWLAAGGKLAPMRLTWRKPAE